MGGAVRDAILGKSPKDFDLTTDAKPDEGFKDKVNLKSTTNEVGKSFRSCNGWWTRSNYI